MRADRKKLPSDDLIFVSSLIQHPRHQKRILSLSKILNVTVFYYTRPQYPENRFVYSGEMVDLGFVENKRYYKRIGASSRLFSKLVQSKINNVYCCSVDHALLAMLAGKRVFLEVGDLYQFGRLRLLYRILDAYLIKRLRGIVLTSPFFEDRYYRMIDGYESEKVLVVENKLPKTVIPLLDTYLKNVGPWNSDTKKIGIIGSIRFPNILSKIRDIVSQRSEDFELHLYGDGCQSIFEGVANCYYHGAFKNPEDLPRIYDNIHVNLIMYDTSMPGVRLALPNKLYESVAFRKPIICSNNCALAEVVDAYGIGCSSSLEDLESSIDEVFENYHSYSKCTAQLNKDFYIDDDRPLLEFVSARLEPQS